jgi:hypothetical protein
MLTSWKTSEPQGPMSLFWIVTFEHVKGPSALCVSFLILRMVEKAYIWTHDQPLSVSLYLEKRVGTHLGL